MSRVGKYYRKTEETEVEVEINLDEGGKIDVSTPYNFLNHMLETFLHYANFSGKVIAREIKKVDDHHVIEDVAICLGRALRAAIQESSICRFGWCVLPMDDALVMVAIDICGRPYFRFRGKIPREYVGDVAVENIKHFLYSFTVNLLATLHVHVLDGENAHHIVEAIFKALGFAIWQATRVRDRTLSTKGVIDLLKM